MNAEFQKTIERTIQKCVTAPWKDPVFYQQYLAQTYYYTSHSTRLLALAAARTSLDQKNYYSRAIKHISEENGHENLALLDLRNLGGQIQHFPELPITRALWQPQYYLTDRTSTSLLGYILSLEWLAVAAFSKILPIVRLAYGDKSVNFIRVHSQEDVEHIKECLEQIEELDDKANQLVTANFNQTCYFFEKMILASQQSFENEIQTEAS